MRITKEHEERKNEILNKSEKLFYTKGYEKCTINDILKEVQIAKGTFYYYFKSKEEVLDGVVMKYTEIIKYKVKKVAFSKLQPEEKLMNSFLSMNIIDETLDSSSLEGIHKPENALLQKKSFKQIISNVAPLLTKIIEEGNEKKCWNCQFPTQYMQIFLAASITITDESIFESNGENYNQIIFALISLLEKMLNVPSQSFTKMFAENFS